MENATNPGGSQPCPKCRYRTHYAGVIPCDRCGGTGLDASATLVKQGEVTFAGEENPAAPGREATAGVAPNGSSEATTESVQGKDEQEEGYDFFRFLMETNEPPQGISASNRDWLRTDTDGGS